jgi:hypothetical protein
MVMVVEVTIEKRGLVDGMKYAKFPSFCNSILQMVALAYYSHNTSLTVKVQGRLLELVVNCCNTVVTGIIYLAYGCTKAFPNHYRNP